jgi:DNA helicase-2/ATP-dependent DNA helicase PcrA
MAFDDRLKKLVQPENKKSFFLFAGAGTGKTFTLVELLKEIECIYAKDFRVKGKHCAVITYTNAAIDEIKRRINYSSIFSVSTIHSFIWVLIKPFQTDIKKTLIGFKQEKLSELKEKLEKANPKGKTYASNVEKYDNLSAEIKDLKEISVFSYDPNGNNQGRGSLNHSDVIKIGAKLISEKPLMQQVLISGFPIVIIDEGQDTNKTIMDALLVVHKNHPDDFKLGVLGDVKQRIYLDGEPDMESLLDDNWFKEKLCINWRSDKRIVRLANKIAENLEENSGIIPQEDVSEGFVHLFIKGYEENLNKNATEKMVRSEMSTITADDKWLDEKEVEELLLEHRMAATRLGFEEFFDTFKGVKKYDQGFLDGTVSDMGIFRNILIPLKQAIKNEDKAEVYSIANDYSLALQDKDNIQAQGKKSLKVLHDLSKKIDAFSKLLENGETEIGKIIDFVDSNNLFDIPKNILFAKKDETDDDTEEVKAWRNAFHLPFKQIEHYFQYINGETEFATHQGVKGLEYPRVMVIIDEKSTKGYMFSYEKLFGAKPLSDRDKENIQQGKESVMDRTMRLFYVCCTRAKHSLAILAYTDSPDVVKRTCMDKGWFVDKEITVL